MKYYMINRVNGYPTNASIEDARRVRNIFKDAGILAQFHKRGEAFIIETDAKARLIYEYLPQGLDIEVFRLKHVVGTFTREDAEMLMQDARKDGGYVNYAAEAFGDVYLDIVTRKEHAVSARLRALGLDTIEWADM